MPRSALIFWPPCPKLEQEKNCVCKIAYLRGYPERTTADTKKGSIRYMILRVSQIAPNVLLEKYWSDRNNALDHLEKGLHKIQFYLSCCHCLLTFLFGRLPKRFLLFFCEKKTVWKHLRWNHLKKEQLRSELGLNKDFKQTTFKTTCPRLKGKKSILRQIWQDFYNAFVAYHVCYLASCL